MRGRGGRRPNRNRERTIDDSCVSLRSRLVAVSGDKADSVPMAISFSQGTPVPIDTNVYQLELSNQSDIYQYEVKIEPEQLNPKMILYFVYQAICPDGGPMGANQKWQNIIFDDTRIYTKLSDLEGEYQVHPTKDETKVVTVKITRTRIVRADDVDSLLTIYNIAFHKAYRTLGLNNFRRKWLDERDKKTAGQFTIINGFVPSISSLSGGMSYLLDVATRIDRDGTLYEYLKPGINDLRRRSDLEEGAKDMLIQTTHLPKKPKTVTISRILWDQYANTFKFERTDRNQNKQTFTIEQYYKEVYNHQCYNDDVLIEMITRRANGVENYNVFPSSVLKTSGISEAERRDNRTMRSIAEVTRILPHVRKQRLDKFVSELKGKNEAYEFLNQWGFEIGGSTRIQGAQIPPPELAVGKKNAKDSTTTLRLDEKLGFQQSWKNYGLLSIPEYKTPCLCISSSEFRGKLEGEIIPALKKVSQGLGIELPEVRTDFVDNTHPNDYKQRILDYMSNNDVPGFIICVLPGPDKHRYSEIKKLLTVSIGIPSQCVKEQTFEKNAMSVCTNLAIQIVSKTGGVPFKVTPNTLKCGHTMVVGLAMTTGKGSSMVCAATATTDAAISQYISNCHSLQRGDNIIPESFLNDFMEKALGRYNELTGEYPKRIVVYRDGVSYGQMPKLKEKEVQAIVNAVENTVQSQDVSIVFMIAQKNGSIRLLKEGKELTNTAAGTVVTDKIGVKDVAEFYMVSHYANQGSASPTRYTIIHHYPVTWNDDELILLTHYLTLQYPNWSGSIRVPTPLMLASRLAEMSRSFLGSQQASENLQYLLHFL